MAAAFSKHSETRRRLIPRALEPRVVQLRRDLRAIFAGIRGERAPAYLVRDGARYGGRTSHGLATRELEITDVRRETADALTLRLRDPRGGTLPAVRAGQFFTLLLDIDGQQLRRAYSVSSDCRERMCVELTIKRVVEGRVSSWLAAHAHVGMRVQVLGPSGEFARQITASTRELVMIAGGSGITPMMAILRTLLPSTPELRVTLIYANRSLADVIFGEALAELATTHASQLQLVHVLEQPPAQWSGPRGRCDRGTLAAVLDDLPGVLTPTAEVLLCGPAPMMDAARELLRELGVDEARVYSESFVAPQLRQEAQIRGPQPLTVAIAGREVGLLVQPGQTVLEAGLMAQLALPYSCAMGGCGACKVTLERGEVVMREPNCLGPSERAQGFVLACVASPISPCRVRVNEDGGT